MGKHFLLFLFVLVYSMSNAQQKVANYFTGKYGTKNYEHFSFWIKDGKPSSVEYSYGEKPKDIVLEIKGIEMRNGKKALKIQFPNRYVLFIAVDGKQLHISDASALYNKTFQW